MEKLNREATAVFMRLIRDISGSKKEGACRFDVHKYWPECKGGIMAVHVERIGFIRGLPVYSVAHYYKQNGDMMRDPDMEFAVKNGAVIPLTYRQDSMGLFQESIWEEGGQLKIAPRLQRELKNFANQWMLNIKEQQNL